MSDGLANLSVFSIYINLTNIPELSTYFQFFLAPINPIRIERENIQFITIYELIKHHVILINNYLEYCCCCYLLSVCRMGRGAQTKY